jgi:hypothetical protein
MPSSQNISGKLVVLGAEYSTQNFFNSRVELNADNVEGPVDVERQCGVMKDGVACARSLTCKSHSMGAKRAVAGRSLPYDMLLAAYQKKNQAKQQSQYSPTPLAYNNSQPPQKRPLMPMHHWKMKTQVKARLTRTRNSPSSWLVSPTGIPNPWSPLWSTCLSTRNTRNSAFMNSSFKPPTASRKTSSQLSAMEPRNSLRAIQGWRMVRRISRWEAWKMMAEVGCQIEG